MTYQAKNQKSWYYTISYGVMLTTETSSGFSICMMVDFTGKFTQSGNSKIERCRNEFGMTPNGMTTCHAF